MPYWRNILQNAPKYNKTLYEEGRKMYRSLADKTCIPTIKHAYIDTLFDLYEKQQTVFGEEGYLAGQKAIDVKHFFPDDKERYDTLIRQSLEIQQEKSAYYVIFPYFIQQYKAFVKKEMTYDAFLDRYNDLIAIIDYNVNNEHPQKEKYMAVKAKMQRRQQILAQKIAERELVRAKAIKARSIKAQRTYDSIMIDYLKRKKEHEEWLKSPEANTRQIKRNAHFSTSNCWPSKSFVEEVYDEEFILTFLSRYVDVCMRVPNPADSIYHKFSFKNCIEVKNCFGSKYESDDLDIQTVKQYYYHLRKQNCQNDSLRNQILFKLYELEPNIKLARMAGKKAYRMGDYDKAIHYFEESLNFEPDKIIEGKTYMLMADAERKKSTNLTPLIAQNARKYTYKAIELIPDWDKPYLFIGDLYADSMELCGADDTIAWEGKVVIWAAYDMWIEAANISPYKDTKTKVEECIKEYKQYLPTTSEGLQHSIQEGQNYYIDCWINQTTKARFRAD